MLKRIARFVLEPLAKVLRKFFDPRFSKLESQIAATSETLEVVLARDLAMRDAITVTNTGISGTVAYLQDAQAKLDLLFLLDAARSAMPSATEQLGGSDAELLNHAESHRGFRSQAGLWFNPPDVVRYSAGTVELSVMTERSIEVPYVISSVAAAKEQGANVLDVGCSESLIPFELASIGYNVTGIDLREYPLDHPNLTTIATPLEDWDSEETFDVVVCLSSIEHFGLGTYGEQVTSDRLDHKAMQLLLDKTKPTGVLVMTIPFGETNVTPVQRMYDRADIDELLKGWTIDTFEVAVPAAQGWVVSETTPEPGRPTRHASGSAHHRTSGCLNTDPSRSTSNPSRVTRRDDGESGGTSSNS